MNIATTIMFIGGMLLLALLLQPLTQRFRLPLAAILVATGFIVSELLVFSGMDTGIRHDNFHDLIFYVFLPLLVFDAAFKIDSRLLLKNLLVILILALPIMLLSTFISAAMIYHGIAHPQGFPWIAALITGALLSATDPVAVMELFKRFGVPERLNILMDGESLFNDATAIVTFSIFIYIALHPLENISVADASIRFLVVFFGGMLIGLLTGMASLFMSRLFEQETHQALISLLSAYAAYLIAEYWLHVSGIMAVMVAGLIMSRVIHEDFLDKQDGFVDKFWSFNAYVANAIVFLLMGVTVTTAMFTERWLAMLIGIAAVLIARAVGIFMTAPLVSKLPWAEAIPMNYQQTMYLGGLRGAVTLALALSIPVELDYWWTIQSIAFGVVTFTLFVQAPMIEPLIRKNGLVEK